MIVWGGFSFTDRFNNGSRYNPSANSWTATSTANVPTARSGHSAIWTGSEVIVWGGTISSSVATNTGGRYCVGTPPTPTANAATFVASGSLRANWSSVSGASGYRLDVATNSSFGTYVTGYQS